MLRVRIELVPHGIESAARTLQTLTVANVGGNAYRGEYRAELREEGRARAQTTVITDWPRLERDAVALVHEALSRLIADR